MNDLLDPASTPVKGELPRTGSGVRRGRQYCHRRPRHAAFCLSSKPEPFGTALARLNFDARWTATRVRGNCLTRYNLNQIIRVDSHVPYYRVMRIGKLVSRTKSLRGRLRRTTRPGQPGCVNATRLMKSDSGPRGKLRRVIRHNTVHS